MRPKAQWALCPVCNRDVLVSCPAGGDGSAMVFHLHRRGAKSGYCSGSRAIVPDGADVVMEKPRRSLRDMPREENE